MREEKRDVAKANVCVCVCVCVCPVSWVMINCKEKIAI